MKSFLDIATCIVKGERPLKCEACGEPFTCGASLAGCWCGEIKLSDETRAELRTTYKECLCQRCLEKARAEASS
jgi:cysteine-rich CWC protein